MLSLPTAINKDNLINYLLLEWGEYGCLYGDSSFLKIALQLYSNVRLSIWTKLESTLHYDYNPIHNYDRTETYTEEIDNKNGNLRTNDLTKKTDNITDDNISSTRTPNLEYNNTRTYNVDDNTTETHNLTLKLDNLQTDGGQDITTDGVVAFNTSPDFTEHKKSVTQYGKTINNDGTNKDTGTLSTDASKTGTVKDVNKETGKDQVINQASNTLNGTVKDTGTVNDSGHYNTKTEHSLRAYGNIGVTTTQKMIEEEREIDQFDIYHFIAEDIATKFLILVS